MGTGHTEARIGLGKRPLFLLSYHQRTARFPLPRRHWPRRCHEGFVLDPTVAGPRFSPPGTISSRWTRERSFPRIGKLRDNDTQ